MRKINLTIAYGQATGAFLRKFSGNTMLESAIKMLERDLADTNRALRPGVQVFTMRTALPGRKYSHLSCVYIFRADTGDVAPCFLFFPNDNLAQPLNTEEIKSRIAEIRKELGW